MPHLPSHTHEHTHHNGKTHTHAHEHQLGEETIHNHDGDGEQYDHAYYAKHPNEPKIKAYKLDAVKLAANMRK